MTDSRSEAEKIRRSPGEPGTRTYIAIDLKSFYASVECRERGLDPLTTNLVVADPNRTEKTICLAVSPSLKAYGIPGRARLFEVLATLKKVNAHRKEPVDFIIAPPQMGKYMEVSASIYQVYMEFIAPEDIHVYSIDEVFLDATNYLGTYGLSPHDLTRRIISRIYAKTGITATAGIGTNLYLAKVAMDIVAKHIPADEDGVRIAELTERSYREKLWVHQPLTDFWRVGRGIANKLQQVGLLTMGDVARCSLGGPNDYYNEDLLYRLFGVNAELLIDHAWGYEPVTMAAVKAYEPEQSSVSSGQVLQCPYTWEQGKVVTREMTEMLVLDLVDKQLMTDQIVLTIGYDIENLQDPERRKRYRGPVVTDHYGRQIPKHAHGTVNLKGYSSSSRRITEEVMGLYDRIVDPNLLIRRFNVTANHLANESEVRGGQDTFFEQMDLFTDYSAREQEDAKEQRFLEREKKMQHAMLDIKKKFGKNAILKGSNLYEESTARQRNSQIGGHRAGDDRKY